MSRSSLLSLIPPAYRSFVFPSSLSCRRHRAIFRLNHPHRPAVDTTLPPFIPSPKLFPPTTILLPPLRPIPSNLDLNDIPALKAEYKLDPESFDATYPGISEGWRKEKKKKRDRQRAETEGRSYKMVLRKGKKEVVGVSFFLQTSRSRSTPELLSLCPF